MLIGPKAYRIINDISERVSSLIKKQKNPHKTLESKSHAEKMFLDEFIDICVLGFISFLKSFVLVFMAALA